MPQQHNQTVWEYDKDIAIKVWPLLYRGEYAGNIYRRSPTNPDVWERATYLTPSEKARIDKLKIQILEKLKPLDLA